MVRSIFLILLFTGIISKGTSQGLNGSIQLKTPEGEVFSVQNLKQNEVSVVYFLSPECPLCQSYAPTIRMIKKKYESLGAKFYVVFPGKNYHVNEIKTYLKNYNLDMPCLLDPNFKLTKSLGASITPEVFVITKNSELLYQGPIDNWAYDLGKKRQVITKFYLRDAIAAGLMGIKLAVEKEKAIGCFIQ